MSSASAYSPLDRLLHHVAFTSPKVQQALCALEDDLFASRLAAVHDGGREVFVTGLPRSGTTLLLEMLYATGEFATFTYRHMPFILAPLLWERLSRLSRRAAATRERAHGDGMDVSFDSPEAFEEVVWLSYLRERYVRPDRILPLAPDLDPGPLAKALRGTIRKLILLEGARRAKPPRYLSKNNANIARLGLLARLFPSATILIPFRHPLAHVGSLMTQHERFLHEQTADRFSRNYMRWIGHFEFGAELRPIDFDGWIGTRQRLQGVDTGFWLRYWTAAYRHALTHCPSNAVFVDFDALLRGGPSELAGLAEFVGLERTDTFIGQAAKLRAPTSQPAEATRSPSAELRAALATHELLMAEAKRRLPTAPLVSQGAV